MYLSKCTVGTFLSRAINFTNLPKNLFRRFNFHEFMPSAILYRNNLIFVDVIFANLQKIAKSVKFTALKKRRPTVTCKSLGTCTWGLP